MITLGHGAGGRLSHLLVRDHFLPRFQNKPLEAMLDSAILGDIAVTIDGHVVTPRFFPGGDLGRLALCGTVNDLAMVGAKPLGITAGFILEEGLPLEELDRIIDSMAIAAKEAEVAIVAGDTKVVSKGACDGIFITTSGVGRMDPDFKPSPEKVRPGDVVISSGTLGDHGMAIMVCREGLPIKGDLKSDVAPVIGLVNALREERLDVHALRDPTRGGIAQSLIEIADAAGLRITLEEEWLPIRPQVVSACELLGIDPLYVANEGKLVAILPEEHAQKALDIMRANPLGKNATIIGKVISGNAGLTLKTTIGAERIVRMPAGELLPRIC
jgi:hydrogenase expression/formation protein HypE